MTDAERLREALRLLLDHALDRADRHPHGHLLPPGEAVELRLSLPLTPDEGALDALAGQLGEALDGGIDELLAHAAVFRPGHVLCLRCGQAECEHSAPPEPRQVFAGYGPTGTPRWVDFGQWLLDRHDPRVEQLYAEDGALVTGINVEEDLTRDLLPAFRDRRDVRIHGQAVAGWYRVPDGTGRRQALAVTVQVISSRPRGARRRFAINVLGRGPDGESLERLHDRIGAIPWTAAVRWAQGVLNSIALEGNGRLPEPALARRVEGLLGGLARRLARVQRARERRTHHAEERHESGARPTRMAVLDLSRAEDASILVDERRRTVVVLGDRGRAHVFNAEGKLVTSVRYPLHTIEHRRETGIWRPATPEEAAALRARIASPEAG